MAILITIQTQQNSITFDQKMLLKMLGVVAALVAGFVFGFAALTWSVSFFFHLALNLFIQACAQADHAPALMQVCLLLVVGYVLYRVGKLIARAVRSFLSW